jgi:hypothetical protein
LLGAATARKNISLPNLNQDADAVVLLFSSRRWHR